jgi:hypothetical protein
VGRLRRRRGRRGRPAGGGAAAEAVEEKTEFDVILTGDGGKKIQVIKEVRAITALGLTEAKTLVESAPKPIKEGVNKAEAEEIKSKIEAPAAPSRSSDARGLQASAHLRIRQREGGAAGRRLFVALLYPVRPSRCSRLAYLTESGPSPIMRIWATTALRSRRKVLVENVSRGRVAVHSWKSPLVRRRTGSWCWRAAALSAASPAK